MLLGERMRIYPHSSGKMHYRVYYTSGATSHGIPDELIINSYFDGKITLNTKTLFHQERYSEHRYPFRHQRRPF